jgi:thiol-disulfide isomerase/thioredoxin
MIKRRNMLFASTAVAAGLAGVGAAWWLRDRHEAPLVGNASADPFWALEMETPDGAMFKVSSLAGRPLLVNFWATWCPPCVEELPLLNRFHQEQQARGWRVLGLAVDQPSAVRAWLQKSPLDFPIVMAGLAGTDLSKRMGNLTGGLPFSVAFGATGQVLQRKSGQLSEQDLANWAALS